jgi:hypothetical protein
VIRMAGYRFSGSIFRRRLCRNEITT